MNRRILAFALATTGVFAAPATIGTLTSKGKVRVDDGQVLGSATLFEGSTVETSVPTQLHLKNGALVGMDANSRSRVYADRIEMERGMGVFVGATSRVNALGMQLVPEGDAKAIFWVRNGAVEVAPLNGAVKVMSASGALLGRVAEGDTLAFEAPADQGGAAQSDEETKKKKRRGAGGAAGGAGKAGKAGAAGGMSAGTKAAIALLVIGGAVGGTVAAVKAGSN